MTDKKADANWSCSLDVDCPECEHNFDVISTHEVSDVLRGIMPCESGQDIELICPECEHEFTAHTSY